VTAAIQTIEGGTKGGTLGTWINRKRNRTKKDPEEGDEKIWRAQYVHKTECKEGLPIQGKAFPYL